jgi:DNA-binding transcriptional MocR family regulator
MIDWDARYASRAGRMAASEMRELLKVIDRPGIISFAGGIPDPQLFPREEIVAAYHEILSDPARCTAALQYAVSEGYQPLRDWIAGYMGSRGVECGPDNILVTSGAQQALDFVGKLFIGKGGTVLTATPTYLGALQAFNVYEPEYAPLPDGSNSGAVRLQAAPTCLGYVMPDFQNPTGLNLSLARRYALLDAAHAHQFPLLEDAAYEALRYDGDAVPSLIALDAQRTGGIENVSVIYCGTFSKTIVPGLRVGWIAAPRAVIRKLVVIKQAADLHSSQLNQMVMYEVARKTLSMRTEIIRNAYRERRDAMLNALTRHMPAGVSWTKPEGGMFVWVTLPEHVDAGVVFSRALAEAQVAFVPGRAFFPDRSVANALRLNFTRADPATIATGIQRLSHVLQAVIEHGHD